MPDLGFAVEGIKSTNFITPRIGMTPGGRTSSVLTADTPENVLRRESMTQSLMKTQYGEGDDGLALRTAKFLGSAGVDMADMVAGSLVPGVERGDVWNQARDMGLDSLANFAERNRSGVEITSGLVAAVATAGIADAFLVPAMATRLASSSALTGTKLWQWGERAMGGAKAAATDSAIGAALNGELATVFGTAGGRALLKARVAEGVARAGVQEAAVAAVTHSNQEMWSDDASTNLAFIAMGLGIGGGLATVGARYEMRAIANSDELIQTRQAATDAYGWTSLRETQPTPEEVAKLGAGVAFKESTNTVGLMMTARGLADESATPNMRALVEAEAKQAEIQAQRSLQKITSKGIPGASNTSFTLDAPTTRAAGAHLTEAMHADPTVMLGIDSLGLGNVTRTLEARKLHIQALRDAGDTKSIRQAQALEEQEFLGLVNGSWMPDSKQLRELSEYQPGQIKLTPTTKAAGNFEFKLDLKDGRKLTINEGGNVKGFESMGITDQLRVYEGLNQVAGRMIKANQQYVIPKNASWLQLDFALQFKKKGGKLDFAQTSLKDVEQIEIESLKQKAKTALAKGSLDFWDRARLNLALPNSLERIHDGTSEAMLRVLQGVESQPNITMKEVKEIRKQLLEMSDLRTGIKQEAPEVSGNMFEFNRGAQGGEWRPVVLGFGSTPKLTPELLGTREQLVRMTAENKAFRIQQLSKGILSSELTTTLTRSPEFMESLSIRGLARDQVTGARGALDQGLGTFVTRTMRYRDSKAMLAAFRVREMVDRAAEEYTNRFITRVFEGSQNRLASAPNAGSKTLVNQWFSFAGGWDLKKGVTHGGDGYYSFQLADTAKNAQRLGRAVRPDDVLTNPATGRAVVLDDAGLDYVQRFQLGAQQLLRDTNAVRASRGMTPLESKEWYAPPPSTRGKIIGFTIDANGKTVPGGAIVASSQEEFDQLRRAKLSQLEAEGKGHRFYSQSEIEASDDLWDLSEMGWVDPGFIGAKKASQTGSIFGDRVNPNAMEESLQWVTDKIRAVTNGTVRSIYDQQLAIARARSAAESAVSGADRRTIYDEWEATVLGKPLTSVKPGSGTKVIRAAEELAQSVINSGWPLARAIGATQTSKWIEDLAHRMGISRVKGFRTFDELATQLGPHTPYKNTLDFVEANMRVSVPPEVKDIAAGVNRFTASMLLRWLEFPNAAMNMLGIVTNMPSILRSPNTPLIGSLTSAKGVKIGVVDSHKILAGGFKDMLSPTSHADWDYMVKNGDTSQSVAELNKQLSLVDSKSTWQRVMMGDKTIQVKPGKAPKSGKELSDWLKYKGVDGLVSLATDTTESMSRTWAHFVGLRLADMNGIVGKEARHSFARNVANQAIANYNPLNKPEIFQTSIGSMFGLFASYMQQYNQRLFRWAEVKDYASIGRQLAMQSTLFGVSSVPGYNGLEWLFQQLGINPGDNPEATLTDAIYAKFGPKVGAAVAHGGIQELPRVFGFDESVALYTRGDANFRAPTLDPTRLMAGLNVVASIAEGTWELASKSIGAATSEDSTLTWRYVSETLARNMPNRAIKGAMTVLMNGGQEVDASGQIVSETQTWLETGLRLSGLRSGRQQGEVEAYYANQAMRRRLASRMEGLREETRALIRSGKPFDPMTIFNKYVEKGGAPSHFKTWIQDQMKVASDSRGMRQLVDSLKSPNTQMEAWRYEMRQ